MTTYHDYDPWETHSGTKFLSPEQREYYNKHRKGTYDEFKDDPLYSILPVGTWGSFSEWRLHDLKDSGKCNPMILALACARERISKIQDAQYAVKCEYEKGILSEDYARQIELHLEIEKMCVYSDFNLKLKPVYRRLKKQRDEDRKLSLTQDDTPKVEREKMECIMITDDEKPIEKIIGE